MQHELNHRLYNHNAKELGLGCLVNYLGFLVGYAGSSLATNYAADVIQNSARDNRSAADLVRTARPYVSTCFGFGFSAYVLAKFSPVYGRYCEEEADLGIDNDPVVINGLIKYMKDHHDQMVSKFGQEFVKQHPKKVFGDHPTSLERIAYLEKKLQKCSSNEVF